MQPFPVICETCHARLKVRSESVIGQILACPKCGSMVAIAPPADWSAEGAAPNSAAAEPLPQPEATLAERLHQAPLFLAGGAVVLLSAALVGVLWSRGPTESSDEQQPVTAVADVAEAAIDDSVNSAKTEETSAIGAVAAAPSTPPPLSPPADDTVASQEVENPPAEADPLGFDANAFKVDVPDSEPQSSPVETPTVQAQPVGPKNADLAPHSSLDDPQSAVRLGPISSGTVRARDVKAQLALPIESFDVSQVPLARLVETLSDMAAVPITLDPAALSMAGIAPTQEVTLQAQDTTLAALLSETLAKYGLEYAEQDGQLVVVKPDADRRRSVDYELKDLVEPGEADARRLAELVRQCVAPDSWQAAGGTGTMEIDGTALRVDQAGSVHYQILIFCERLRLARGLPNRSRYPVERLTIAPVYLQLEQRLSKPTTFTFLPWTRLADVFRHWQEGSGVTVLVDWSALAQQELGPTSPVACSVVDQPWQSAFDAILAPLGLSWWAVDGQTVQITSREAASRAQQLQLYPVDKTVLKQYPSSAAYTAALERGLAGRFAPATGEAPLFHVAFDEPSGRLIVLGSPDVQRYMTSKLNFFEPQSHKEHEEE